MKKWILLILMTTLITAPLEAKPSFKTVLRKTFEYGVYAAPIVTSLLATHEGNICRQRNDVAVCSGGYGPFYGREYGIRLGASVTFSGLSMYGHKAKFKEWFAPAVGMSIFNSYVAYQQNHVHSVSGK